MAEFPLEEQLARTEKLGYLKRVYHACTGQATHAPCPNDWTVVEWMPEKGVSGHRALIREGDPRTCYLHRT